MTGHRHKVGGASVVSQLEIKRTGHRGMDEATATLHHITPAILGGNKEVQEFVEIPQITASALRLE